MTEQSYDADYSTQDLEFVFGGRDWTSWEDAIRWLEDEDTDTQTMPADTRRAMRDDFAQLEKDRVAFTLDAASVYALTHQARSRHRG